MQLVKELLAQLFSTPKRHHKSKPFFDHVMSFSVADGRIWMRNYQVCLCVMRCVGGSSEMDEEEHRIFPWMHL